MAHPDRIPLDQEEASFTFGKALASVDLEDVEKDFDESKHPRDSEGKFTESGGGDGPSASDLQGEADEQFHVTDKYGLSLDEEKRVDSWLGDGYRTLRTNPAFGKTLEKFPLYSGRVFRGTRLYKADLERLKIGATFEIKKFSSSSIRRSVAETFIRPEEDPKLSGRTPVVMEIDDTGRKIPREYALNAGVAEEAEVVLMTGDRYKITEVDPTATDENGNNYTRVRMQHVAG